MKANRTPDGWFHSFLLFVVLSLVAATTGCGGTSSVAGASPKTLTAVSISPGTADIAASATEQFAATATYSDGSTANVTSMATWSSAAQAVATISTSGLASGISSGSSRITASMNSVSGTAMLDVNSKTLTSIAVSPANPNVFAGATQQFTATATYNDGSTANVTSTAAWSSANSAVVRINSAGLATAMAAGSASITATLSGASGMTIVTVPAPTLKSIAVSPTSANVSVGATQQFTATATYNDGSTAIVTSMAAWSSANSAVVKINAAGLATGVAAGSTNITATLSGVSGMTTVTIVAPTLKSIAVSPANPNVSVGATQQFTATATYSDGSAANVTSTAAWSSATQTVATISISGLATGVASGSTTITASVKGVNGTAMLSVNSKIIKSIAVTPNPGSFSMGTTQQFTATATYSDGSTANVTSTVAWTVANTTVATISISGLATGVASGSTTITASLKGVNGTAMLSVNSKTIKSIAVTPNPGSFSMGTTQQFTATATYSDGSTANVTSTVAWTVANTTVATISSGGLASGIDSGSTSVTASQNGVNGTDSFVVTIAPGTGVDVLTYHFDSNRSGLNPGEQSLAPANVSPQTFGKLFSYIVDGYVYGQPLLVSNLTINGSTHNVLYAATENDSVYAFDADNYGTGAPLWKVSLLETGEVPIGGSIKPYEGVTSTPVIDLSTKTIYVVSVEVKSGSPATFRLNALDLTTGAQKFGGPVVIQASVAGTNSQSVNGIDSLAPLCLQRAALLLANGTVYIGFGSCHQGWLLAYDAQTLAQTAVFNTSPNLNGEGTYSGGGGIWMGGSGPVADSAGNVYVTTGNGPWDGQTAWGDSVLKFNAQLQMEDYFTPQDYQYMDCNDADLAGGGLLLIPGTTEAMAGGKSSKLYLVNTANLGHEQANDAGASQAFYLESDLLTPYPSSCTDSLGTHTMDVDNYQDFGTAAYFNGSVYLGVTPYTTVLPAGLRQFTYSSGTLTPGAYIAHNIQESSYGTAPFISANGTSNGILWMIDHGSPIQSNTPTSATLYAYDTSDLTKELYNSSTNTADVPGYGIKFTSPIVANGKVYISTGHDLSTVASPRGEIDVYGLK
jgi:uncharacterized protein YjdB